MKFLKNAVDELWSLFVDDPVFVGLITAWILAVYFARPLLPRSIAGPILFAGFALLLIAFAYRQAVRKRVSLNGQ
jgi:hypothetical protein